MNKFLSGNDYLYADLSNLSNHAKSIIQNISGAGGGVSNIINPQTNKIYSQYIPDSALDDVYTFSTYPLLISTITNPEVGAMALIMENSSIYVYTSALVWHQISFFPMNINNIQQFYSNGPVEGELLSYSVSDNKYINRDLSYYSINSLYDVDRANIGILNKNFLKWDGSKFVSHALVISDITNVSIITPNGTQSLIYSAPNWVNGRLTYTLNEMTDLVGARTAKHVPIYNTSNFSLRQLLMNDITEFNIGTSASGDILRYNGSKYVNYVFNLNDIANVNDSNTKAQSDVLIYNASNTEYETRKMILNDITGFNINLSLSNKQVIYWNGTNFINRQLTLLDISDVDPSLYVGITNYQFMVYNSTSTQWESRTVLPHPTTVSVNSVAYSNGSSYQLLSNTLENHNNVQITSVQNFDILQYNSTNSKYENKKRYKSPLLINASIDFDMTHYERVLYFNTQGLFQINISAAFNSLNTNSNNMIEIYNIANAKILITKDVNSSINIHSNTAFLMCGKYTTIRWVSTNNYVFSTDDNNNVSKLYYKSLLNITNAPISNFDPSTQSNLFINSDNTKLLLNYKNSSTGFRRYLTYNITTMTLINNITTSIYFNSTNTITLDNINYYNVEYGNTNASMIKSTNFYATFTNVDMVINTLIPTTYSKTLIYNPATEKFSLIYYNNSTFIMSIRSYQLSNGNQSTVNPNPIISVPNVVINNIICGWHFQIGIVLMKSAINLYMYKNTVKDDFNNGLNSNQSYSFTNFDSHLIPVEETSMNTNSKMYFLTSSVSNLSLYTINNLATSIIKIADIPLTTGLCVQNAVKIGSFIYITCNSTYAPALIKFNTDDYTLNINYNMFNLTSDANTYYGIIGSNSNGVHAIGVSDTLTTSILDTKCNIF